LAGHIIVVPLHALPDLLAKLVKAFEPDRLSQRIVDRSWQPAPNFLGRNLKHPLLAGHLRAGLGRKGDFNLALFARSDTGQLIAEPGQQSLGAEFDLAALAAAAGDLVSANMPDDVSNDDV